MDREWSRKAMSYTCPTCKTPVGHDLEEVKKVIELEHEAMRRKALLIANGVLDETSGAIMRMRIQPSLLELYQKAPDDVKTLARYAMRSALQAVILAYWLEGYVPKLQDQFNQPVIINLNINNNDVKPKVNVNIDLGWLKDIVSKLYELRQPLPPVQRKLVEQLYEKLRKVN